MWAFHFFEMPPHRFFLLRSISVPFQNTLQIFSEFFTFQRTWTRC
jgi:hypothetical protein